MERKLAAILNADIEGYSRLMGADEAATVRTLTAYRDLMAFLVRQHRGRIVDAPGDNVLVEFASVVEATHRSRTVTRWSSAGCSRRESRRSRSGSWAAKSRAGC